ncbi:MAG: hypothetical protein JNN04_03560 [Cyclobacteriaceae bacterium]|nr:hypothetical protein [Cyclobacteriaceae bacterium]
MKHVLIASLLLVSLTCGGQQRADTLFQFDISHSRYPLGKGPVILLDEAHHNFHTTTGRFRPFSDFLRKDGYVVKGNAQPFTPEVLRSSRILVIANALNAANINAWTLPTPSAFTEDEIRYVTEWVKAGGSLFLIADHMPFPGAAEKLAAAFGFTFYNGFAMRKKGDISPGGALNRPDIFTPGHGLIEGPITLGNQPHEKVTSVRTFTGQAFGIPAHATPLIVLDDDFELLLPKTAWQFATETTVQPAAGLAQGASLQQGKGRVVVFGEAAMFSAQVQRDSVRMGMNAPDAKQNPQFLLNIIHWLDSPRP